MAAPQGESRKLTKEQADWVTAIEAEWPNLPAGYARAMVCQYLDDPSFFDHENIERMAATVIPKMETNDGGAKVHSLEESNQMYEKYVAELQERHKPETCLSADSPPTLSDPETSPSERLEI